MRRALPSLAQEHQLKARGLIGQLEERIGVLGAALAVTAPDTAAGIDPGRQAPLAG